MRLRSLDAVLALGVITVALTEGLSLVHGLNRATVSISWAVVAALLVFWRDRFEWSLPSLPASVVGILGTTFFIAVLSPPNGWDAVSYHMSRVMYWIQDGSVAHFPTHDVRQVVFSPFAEFCLLHLQLIWDGDRLANLVQWGAFAASLCAVAELVKRFGGNVTAANTGMLFAATLPMAVLQASGTENDLMVALWLLVAILAVDENLQTGTVLSALKVGAAAGLLALTKGTGYLLGAPVLGGWALVLLARSRFRPRAIGLLTCAGVLALGINAGHYWRNFEVFGSPLGDPPFIAYHQNTLRSPQALASNLIRNASFHLATPIPAWNGPIRRGVMSLHSFLGLRADDERTTFLGTPFAIEFSTHEDRTGNPLQFAAVVVVLVATATRRLRLRREVRACLGIAVTGYVLLSWSLKWQLWGSRFQTPLFLLMAVPCGIAAAQTLGQRGLRRLSAVFLLACLPWLLANETRPLVKLWSHQPARNLFRHTRAELYVANWPLDQALHDMGLPERDWALKESYFGAIEALERSGCRDVGLLQGLDSWDYPLWPLAQERSFRLRIHQVQVGNATRKLRSDPPDSPCALIVLDSPADLRVPEPSPRLLDREIYRMEPITIYSLRHRPRAFSSNTVDASRGDLQGMTSSGGSVASMSRARAS